jgi:hypothetical protein
VLREACGNERRIEIFCRENLVVLTGFGAAFLVKKPKTDPPLENAYLRAG